MGYAIRNDGGGWRCVDGHAGLLDGEYYSETQPQSPVPESPRKAEIKSRLAQIDIDTLRPLRAVVAGVATQYDHGKLAALESEAAVLRVELVGMEG